jgi:3D (Asp-Asp-Asp) domain-containing protein
LCAFGCTPALAQGSWDAVPEAFEPTAIWVTGYTCPPYCDPTADGTPVGPGSAACPPWWLFGTRVNIEGIGTVTCNDLYDPTLGPRIDVFEPDDDACYQITGWHYFTAVPPAGMSGSSGAA